MDLFKNVSRVSTIVLFSILCPMSMLLAQVRVTPISNQAGQSAKRGVVYALPRTVLSVDLFVTRTSYIPGPYVQFAREYLGTTDHITTSSVIYRIDRAAIRAHAEADPDQFYLVDKEEKLAQEIWLSMSEGGLILGAESLKENYSPAEVSAQWSRDAFTKTEPAILFSHSAAPSLKEVIDTTIRRVAIDTTFIEYVEYTSSFVQSSDREKAQDVIALLNQIEEDKYRLLVGYQETPYSRETLEYMIRSLDQLREDYLSLFKGTVLTETRKFTYRFVPDPGDAGKDVGLAGFSPTGGLSDAAGNGQLTVKITKSGATALLEKDALPQGPSGFYYRIPEPVLVEVSLSGSVLASEQLMVNQMGVVRSLPSNVTRVEFHPQTGAILKLILKD